MRIDRELLHERRMAGLHFWATRRVNTGTQLVLWHLAERDEYVIEPRRDANARRFAFIGVHSRFPSIGKPSSKATFPSILSR